MAARHHKPDSGLHPTKVLNSTIAGTQLEDEDTPWQQLMLYDYLMFETIDAMEQERATGNPTPLNDHWQQFIQLLRHKKPKLGVCLDNLRNGFLAEQEGLQ